MSGREFESPQELKEYAKKICKGQLILQPGKSVRVRAPSSEVGASVINGSPATSPIDHAVVGEWVRWTAHKKNRAKSKRVERVTYCLRFVANKRKAEAWFSIRVAFAR